MAKNELIDLYCKLDKLQLKKLEMEEAGNQKKTEKLVKNIEACKMRIKELEEESEEAAASVEESDASSRGSNLEKVIAALKDEGNKETLVDTVFEIIVDGIKNGLELFTVVDKDFVRIVSQGRKPTIAVFTNIREMRKKDIPYAEKIEIKDLFIMFMNSNVYEIIVINLFGKEFTLDKQFHSSFFEAITPLLYDDLIHEADNEKVDCARHNN